MLTSIILIKVISLYIMHREKKIGSGSFLREKPDPTLDKTRIRLLPNFYLLQEMLSDEMFRNVLRWILNLRCSDRIRIRPFFENRIRHLKNVGLVK